MVACRETTWTVARGLTLLPSSFQSAAEGVEPFVEAALGRHLDPSNPVRRALATYWHLAGNEGGYGYFAPNVPGTFKLIFELDYPDGSVGYALPRVSSNAAGLRIASLVDEIGRTPYEPLREYMVRSLATATWREHPDARIVRAVFGTITPPSIAELEQGKPETYRFLFAYDFSRADAAPERRE
jgi:hypothetical protein